jgi:hypothetical protein
MTVEDFKRKLQIFPDEWEVEFSGLTFYRFKARGEKLVNLEFNEPFEALHNPETNQDDLILRIKPPAKS